MRNPVDVLRGSTALFLIGMKTSLAYKLDLGFSVFFRIASSLAMLLVWTAVFLSSGATKIGGFSLPFMYAYFFLYGAVSTAVYVNVADAMQNDISSGNIATSLIRPMNYPLQVLSNALGGSFIWAFFTAVPLGFIVILFMHANFAAYNAALLIIELALGCAIYALVNFIVGVSAVYLTETDGVLGFVNPIITALGGGIAPLALLPASISGIAMLLPFQMLGYTEVVTMLGTASQSQIYCSICISLLWLVGLGTVAFLSWNGAFRSAEIAGG